MAKFAPNGAKVWEQTIGGNQDDTLTLLQSDGAGGYILAGDSASDVSGTKNSAAIGGGDFWLLDLAVFDQPAGTPVIQVNGIFATGGVILSDTPAQVAITTSFPGGNINYTLDGSTPGKASSSYTQPFIVSNSATLRAVAYNSASSHSAEAEPVQLQITTSFALDTGTAGNGTITVDPTPGPYLPGTVVTLTATPIQSIENGGSVSSIR